MTVFLQPVNNVFVAVSIMALQPFLELYTELSSSTMMLAKDEQPINGLLLIEVTLWGIVMLVK